MALEMMVDSLDGVADNLKSLYIETDGKFALDVTGGEDVTGLKSALESERLSNRASKKLISDMQAKFRGIDPDAVRGMLAQAETDAEAKLIAEGKIQEVMNARLAKHQAATESDLAERDATIKSLRSDTLKNILRAKAGKAGLHKSAIEDAVARGLSIFSLGSDNKAVQLGEDNEPVLGKDGKTNFSPSEWLDGMKETAPHWFPAGSSGSGSGGQGSGSPGAASVDRATFDAMSDKGKFEFAAKGGMVT